MKSKKSLERGQALVVIALAIAVLFGFTALAIDGSAKFSDRRHAQNAADTAALAGALAFVNNDPNWDLDARGRASDNGYTGSLVNDQVWVFQCNDPARLDPDVPLNCGAYEGNENYIEVIILSHIDTTFARVFGWNQFHNLVQAVVLTNKGGPLFNGAAFISVDPDPNCGGGNGNGGGSVDVSGNSTITLNGGGFFVNSDETCGYSQPNCSVTLVINGGGILSAGSNIYVQDKVTGTACNGGGIPTDNTQIQYEVPGGIFMPKEPDECGVTAQAIPLGGNNWRITPGYYTDFPQAGIINNHKNIYMDPGVYCVDDNLSWGGSTFDLLDGTSGVTIYLKSGHDMSFTTNSPILLNASNSGDYENYVIIQAGNMNSIQTCKFTGGQYLEINGTVFAPYCDITINGDGSTLSEFNAQFIGWDLKIDGNSAIKVNYDPDYTPKIKRKIGLMK